VVSGNAYLILIIVTTQILNKEKEIDTKLLRLAFAEGRIIVTHDKKTFPKYAYEQIIRGNQISGVIIVPNSMPIGIAIKELEFLIKHSKDNELENRVKFLSPQPPI
jgi:hypothetical protein